MSTGASTFTPEIPDRPPAGGFSRLLGDNAMMSVLLMVTLFGSSTNALAEIRQLFMHPMFQLLDLMNNLKNGGNIMDALGPILGGQDMGSIGDILAGLGKNNIY